MTCSIDDTYVSTVGLSCFSLFLSLHPSSSYSPSFFLPSSLSLLLPHGWAWAQHGTAYRCTAMLPSTKCIGRVLGIPRSRFGERGRDPLPLLYSKFISNKADTKL